MTMFLCALLASGSVSYLIVRFASLHLTLTGDLPGVEPQKFHRRPVPRIGGLAVAVGLLAAGCASQLRGWGTSGFLWLMLAALLPAFIGGFAEDLTRRVIPAIRLLFTVVSAAIAFIWLDANLYRSDIDWLDAAFTYWPVSFLATMFAVAGVAHAMNIIDGYNGLSTGVGVLALVAIAMVCRQVGDHTLTNIAFAAAGAYLGFLVFNFPFGRLFQGDSGAYLLGTIIAILSAQIVGRHHAVSPWFPFALVVYPVWETLFSMLRRAALHVPIGSADAQHLHSLIYQVAMPRLLPNRDPVSLELRNSGTSVPLWLAQLVMVGMAIRWYDSTEKLMIQCYGFVGAYCLAYVAVALLDRRRQARVETEEGEATRNP